MRWMILSAALALGTPQDDAAERLQAAIQWLGDPDETIREMGRRTLLEMGPAAVPRLEEILKAKGAYEIHRILRDLGGPAGRVSEVPPPLPDEKEFLARFPPVEASAAERYVASKMAEAFKAARAGQYQKGFDISQALLALEPKSRYAAELQKLRRTCDNMITQTSLVRTRVASAVPYAVAGETAELILRMENVWKGPLGVRALSGPEAAPTRPVVVVEVTCELHTPNGSVTSRTRSFEVEIDKEIPLAMGAQWERTFGLDTSLEFQDEEDYLRIYTVGGWTPLVTIDWRVPTTRRLFFEPCRLKVVPAKHAHLLEDPVGKLGKAIDAGTINEVFICAMALDEAQKPMGLEMMIGALGKFTDIWKKAEEAGPKRRAEDVIAITANILTAMTGERLGTDVEKWKAYLRKK